MNKQTIKPGWKSSEFWFTAVTFIFSGLYLVGVIGDNAQKEDVIRDVSHGVESMILIGGQLAILWKYINSRKEIKKTWWSSTDTAKTNDDVVKDGDKKNVGNKRTKKSTTRTNKKQSTKSK